MFVLMPISRATLIENISSWTFWFRQQRAPGNKITSYEEGIKKVASFSSVSFCLSLCFHLAQGYLPG